MTDQTNEKYVSEEELQAKAVAPRVTLESIEANIIAENYFTAGDGVMGSQDRASGEHVSYNSSLDLLTFCVLVLRNGFTIVGTSACASPENYDEDIGRRVARGDAIRQIWSLMGYELRSELGGLIERTGANIHGIGPDEAAGPNPNYQPEA